MASYKTGDAAVRKVTRISYFMWSCIQGTTLFHVAFVIEANNATSLVTQCSGITKNKREDIPEVWLASSIFRGFNKLRVCFYAEQKFFNFHSFGVVNRTFGNRAQSNPIARLSSVRLLSVIEIIELTKKFCQSNETERSVIERFNNRT